jgi:hypothetical protein
MKIKLLSLLFLSGITFFCQSQITSVNKIESKTGQPNMGFIDYGIVIDNYDEQFNMFQKRGVQENNGEQLEHFITEELLRLENFEQPNIQIKFNQEYSTTKVVFSNDSLIAFKNVGQNETFYFYFCEKGIFKSYSKDTDLRTQAAINAKQARRRDPQPIAVDSTTKILNYNVQASNMANTPFLVQYTNLISVPNLFYNLLFPSLDNTEFPLSFEIVKEGYYYNFTTTAIEAKPIKNIPIYTFDSFETAQLIEIDALIQMLKIKH